MYIEHLKEQLENLCRAKKVTFIEHYDEEWTETKIGGTGIVSKLIDAITAVEYSNVRFNWDGGFSQATFEISSDGYDVVDCGEKLESFFGLDD